MSCAQCEGIEAQFGQAEARKKLRRFQRRGPDKTTRLLIDALRLALDESDARDAVLLDVGGGVGAIHHELLNGRVVRAIHLDASTAHLAVAREETERRSHGDQVEFVYGDFVAVADRIPTADLVTLDRVICCYDDMEPCRSLGGEGHATVSRGVPTQARLDATRPRDNQPRATAQAHYLPGVPT